MDTGAAGLKAKVDVRIHLGSVAWSCLLALVSISGAVRALIGRLILGCIIAGDRVVGGGLLMIHSLISTADQNR